MVVLPKSGHAVQEDQPVKVAEALATFMVRNKIVQAVATFAPYVSESKRVHLKKKLASNGIYKQIKCPFFK